MDRKPGTEPTISRWVEGGIALLLLVAFALPIIEYKPWQKAPVWIEQIKQRMAR